MSRGVILQDTIIARATEDHQLTYRFTVTPEMMPSILVFASYFREDNKEIVADSIRLNVAVALQNQVHFLEPKY